MGKLKRRTGSVKSFFSASLSYAELFDIVDSDDRDHSQAVLIPMVEAKKP